MKPVVLLAAITLFAVSCKTGVDKEAEKKRINAQSSKNIKAYNLLEAQYNNALQAGDQAQSAVIKQQMDSIMLYNSRLGDTLMQLDRN